MCAKVVGGGLQEGGWLYYIFLYFSWLTPEYLQLFVHQPPAHTCTSSSAPMELKWKSSTPVVHVHSMYFIVSLINALCNRYAPVVKVYMYSLHPRRTLCVLKYFFVTNSWISFPQNFIKYLQFLQLFGNFIDPTSQISKLPTKLSPIYCYSIFPSGFTDCIVDTVGHFSRCSGFAIFLSNIRLRLW